MQNPDLEYNLPDFKIMTNEKDYDFFVWQPDNKYIVLGRSNSIETSVNLENAINDKVKILKRHSGGESVILTEKMLVISAKIKDEEIKHPTKYFDLFNSKIIETLQYFGILNLNNKGISDIAINEKKILGSSIYRRKNIVFYHSVLNVGEDIDLISKYLQHPKKEPDYRKGRSHKEFVTSIWEAGYNLEISNIAEKLNLAFSLK